MPPIFYVSYAALWVLMLTQGVLLLLVYRHFGLISLGTVEGVQRDGLAVGEVALPVMGVTAQGEPFDWSPKPGHLSLLAFVSPSCGPCVKILPIILQMAQAINQIEVILITDGKSERALQLVEQFHPPASVACIAGEGSSLALAYHVRVSPFTFLIGKDGRILAKSLCDSTARLQYLLDAAGLELPPELLEPAAQLLQVKTKSFSQEV